MYNSFINNKSVLLVYQLDYFLDLDIEYLNNDVKIIIF